MHFYKIKEATFENIPGEGDSPGFVLSKSYCNLLIIRSSFNNCRTSSRSGGGGFYADVQLVDIDKCWFDKCYAPDQGCAFTASPNCKNFSADYSLIQNEKGFEQDGYIKNGSESDEFRNSNITNVICDSYVLTSGPQSQTTSFYRYMNIVRIKATKSGLFYTSSRLTIEMVNIVNCNSPSFVCFTAPPNTPLAVIKSVIIDSTFSHFYDYNNPSKSNADNIYNSNETRQLFGEFSGIVETNPSTLKFMYPIDQLGNCSNRCNRRMAIFSLFFNLDILTYKTKESCKIPML